MLTIKIVNILTSSSSEWWTIIIIIRELRERPNSRTLLLSWGQLLSFTLTPTIRARRTTMLIRKRTLVDASLIVSRKPNRNKRRPKIARMIKKEVCLLFLLQTESIESKSPLWMRFLESYKSELVLVNLPPIVKEWRSHFQWQRNRHWKKLLIILASSTSCCR